MSERGKLPKGAFLSCFPQKRKFPPDWNSYLSFSVNMEEERLEMVFLQLAQNLH